MSAAERAADLAEQMLARPSLLPIAILEYPPGAGPIEGREALRPVHAEIVARIGEPTLLGATKDGPTVRWTRGKDTLLLSGDHTAVTLVSVDAFDFAVKEHDALVEAYGSSAPRRPPFLWQLDRDGPGNANPYQAYAGWTEGGLNWTEFAEALEEVLLSFVEHMPVQAPDDWVTFKLHGGRAELRFVYDAAETGRELCALVEHGASGTEEEMRARGWQATDEHGRWRLDLPEADPGSAAQIGRSSLPTCAPAASPQPPTCTPARPPPETTATCGSPA